MSEKQIEEEQLWCAGEEILSYVSEKIRGVSASAGIWLYDVRKEKWYRQEENGSLIPVSLRGVRDAGEWFSLISTENTEPEARIIVGAGSVTAVSVPVVSKGINRGELIAVPVRAEYSAVALLKKKNPGCQVVYDPKLAEIFGCAVPADCTGDEEFRIRTVFYLMRGVKRYLENSLRRRNIQREADTLKSDCAAAEQEGQEISALIDSFQTVREMPASRERINDYIARMRKGRVSAEPNSGAAQMEADMLRMQRIYAKWQSKLCPIRTESEFVHLYLRMKKRMMNGRFRTEIHVSKDCLDLKIPFGTIQSLMETAFCGGLGSFREQGNLSLYIRRDGNTTRISFSDKGYVLSEDRVRELMNLRHLSDPYHMADVLRKETCPALDRMILNMQSLCRDDFILDIVSDEQYGTKIQIRYRSL